MRNIASAGKQAWNLGKVLAAFMVVLLQGLHNPVLADKVTYPDKPYPQVLVSDFAHLLSGNEAAQLERKLDDYTNSTSTQITVVTVNNLGGDDVEDYAVTLFNKWGLGESGKNNGVLLLVSKDDRKAWIAVGKGLEGSLTDIKSGLIFRNELRPAFQAGNYNQGLSDACDAIIAVTKGEYTNEGLHHSSHFPFTGLIILIIVVLIVGSMFRGGGGGGGSFLTGMLLGDLLGGGMGGRGGGWGGDSGGFGGGGFGGFGGGQSGGGGAGGSW